PIAARWAPPSPAVRERGFCGETCLSLTHCQVHRGVAGSASPLHPQAFVAAGALERLVARDRADLLVVIPRALRVGGLLDLEQVHVAHQPAGLEDLAVLGPEVVDR